MIDLELTPRVPEPAAVGGQWTVVHQHPPPPTPNAMVWSEMPRPHGLPHPRTSLTRTPPSGARTWTVHCSAARPPSLCAKQGFVQGTLGAISATLQAMHFGGSISWLAPQVVVWHASLGGNDVLFAMPAHGLTSALVRRTLPQEQEDRLQMCHHPLCRRAQLPNRAQNLTLHGPAMPWYGARPDPRDGAQPSPPFARAM